VTAERAATVVVRRARREDWPRMLELDRELARFEKLAPPNDEEAARLASWIFDTGRAEALVAEVGGRIEGLAIFYEGINSFRARPFLFLEDLVVTEAARGRRVGEALVEAVAREAVARGASRLEWAVLDWNEGALRFYRRLGGQPQTEWLRYNLDSEALTRLAGPPRG
jgi:GNAT superfamily N-acetyltransferase